MKPHPKYYFESFKKSRAAFMHIRHSKLIKAHR
jgi:hypothetical protein